MDVFVIQESSDNSEAETGVKTDVNEPLMKKKSNKGTRNLRILLSMYSFGSILNKKFMLTS
jgi:hypothetical protein